MTTMFVRRLVTTFPTALFESVTYAAVACIGSVLNGEMKVSALREIQHVSLESGSVGTWSNQDDL